MSDSNVVDVPGDDLETRLLASLLDQLVNTPDEDVTELIRRKLRDAETAAKTYLGTSLWK